MTRRYRFILCAAILVLLSAAGCGGDATVSSGYEVESALAACGCAEGFPEGDGTDEAPYVIRSAKELAHISAHSTCSFVLAGDIDLDGTEWTPLCSGQPFSGELNGAGYAIFNLPDALFSAIGSEGSVHDLSLTGDVTLSAGSAYAGSVADCSAGIVQAVESTVSITAEADANQDACVGGLVGYNTGMVRDCSYDGTMTDLRLNGTNIGAIIGLSRVVPPEGLVTMITAHSGFGEGEGSGDHCEWASLDWIIKDFNYLPDFVEVDTIWVPEGDGEGYLGIGHEIATARISGVTLEDILMLYTGTHARSGELVEGYENVRLQIDCKTGGLLKDVLDMVQQAGIPWNMLGFVGGITKQDIEENYDVLCEGIHQGLYLAFSPSFVTGFNTEKLLADPDAFIQAFLETYDDFDYGMDVVVVSINHLYVTEELVEKMSEHGLNVTSATIKSADDIDKCMQIGLYNMTTMAEDALFIRNGLRDGAMYNTYTGNIPEIGTTLHD